MWCMHETRGSRTALSINSGFADLIEWYLLYFGSVLTFKFKMAAQNGCRWHIENQKKVTSLYIDGTFEATLRRPCWLTIVKFIDLFHLWPWPGTIERLDIVGIHTLLPFLPNLVQNISIFPVCTLVLAVILGSHHGPDGPKTQQILSDLRSQN